LRDIFLADFESVFYGQPEKGCYANISDSKGLFVETRIASAGAVLKKPMPIEFDVIRASDFVCFDADEHLDFEESKRVLRELAVACRKRGLARAMVDLRDLPVPEKPRFTDAELASLIDAFCAASFSHRQRLAVLYRQDVHGTIRNFTAIGRKKGLQIQAFDKLDNAMHWLWKETADPVDQKHGTEVPIVQARKKKRAARLADGREHHRSVTPKPVRRLKRH
jgi:hypothetical protein